MYIITGQLFGMNSRRIVLSRPGLRTFRNLGDIFHEYQAFPRYNTIYHVQDKTFHNHDKKCHGQDKKCHGQHITFIRDKNMIRVRNLVQVTLPGPLLSRREAITAEDVGVGMACKADDGRAGLSGTTSAGASTHQRYTRVLAVTSCATP